MAGRVEQTEMGQKMAVHTTMQDGCGGIQIGLMHRPIFDISSALPSSAGNFSAVLFVMLLVAAVPILQPR